MTGDQQLTDLGTTGAALAVFDDAPAVAPEFMFGTWHGAEIPTGHPMDGLLEPSGWWGKAFIDTETVHPLLFPTRDGTALWALNPGLAPLGAMLHLPVPRPRRSLGGLLAALRPVLGTGKPRARLRTTSYRGVDTASMIYDQLPIIDVFRKISDDTVIGAMDLRGTAQPYFFLLRRDESLRLR
ncbi:MAG: DUF4334 domain-containing protein [Mycobacterium sp.]|nr:DUF4334 domain-containing protein [Mycobacterium sp.]